MVKSILIRSYFFHYKYAFLSNRLLFYSCLFIFSEEKQYMLSIKGTKALIRLMAQLLGEPGTSDFHAESRFPKN